MGATVRSAAVAIDDLLGFVRRDRPEVAGVWLSWSSPHRSCAVMGAFDDAGVEVTVSQDVLARWTGVLARPMPRQLLELLFPGDAFSSSCLLKFPVDEPVWARFADAVVERVRSGIRVADDVVRDALWLVLEACAFNCREVLATRVVMVPETPDDTVFEPVQVVLATDASGSSPVPWSQVETAFPFPDVNRHLTWLVDELGLRAERAASLRDSVPRVLTSVNLRLV